jgi:hypothetical protein
MKFLVVFHGLLRRKCGKYIKISCTASFSFSFSLSSSLSKSRDSSVGIALGYGLDDRGSRVRFPEGLGIFLFTTAS